MKYVIANWKMNMLLQDMVAWGQGFDKKVLSKDTRVIISATSVHILALSELLKNTGIFVASQDVSSKEKGAHTGEVGAFQISELCRYSLVGHSERKESTFEVNTKIDRCLENNIIPIICISVPKDTKNYVRNGAIYVWEDPDNISKNGAYVENPVADIIPKIEEISEIVGNSGAVLYGGSVNRKNVSSLSKIPHLDGVLVGNASLDPKHFSEIASYFK